MVNHHFPSQLKLIGIGKFNHLINTLIKKFGHTSS